MPRLHHIGKQVLKFTFELHLCDVRGLPEGVGAISVNWERGGHVIRSKAVTTSTTEHLAMLDAKLRSTATLYRSARRAVFDAKPSTIKVVDASSGQPQTAASVIGTAEFDLAEHANLEVGAPSKVMQLQLHGRHGALLLQFTISSVWLDSLEGPAAYPSDAPDSCSETSNDQRSEHGSDTSGSMASAALTHEALLAFEAQQAANAEDTSRKTAKGGKRWAGGAAGGREASKQTARLAESSQLLEAAEADASQAEEFLASLQERLRSEVVTGTYAAFERASALKNLSEQSKLYKQQLALVIDQVHL